MLERDFITVIRRVQLFRKLIVLGFKQRVIIVRAMMSFVVSALF